MESLRVGLMVLGVALWWNSLQRLTYRGIGMLLKVGAIYLEDLRKP